MKSQCICVANHQNDSLSLSKKAMWPLKIKLERNARASFIYIWNIIVSYTPLPLMMIHEFRLIRQDQNKNKIPNKMNNNNFQTRDLYLLPCRIPVSQRVAKYYRVNKLNFITQFDNTVSSTNYHSKKSK